MWLSLVGSILCVLVMFLISWWTALITFAVILALYLIVSYRKPGKKRRLQRTYLYISVWILEVNWGSTTQAQTYKTALQAVYQLNFVEEHVKNYRPQILVLTGMPTARPALIDFANLLTKALSMLVCGHINNVSKTFGKEAQFWKFRRFRAIYIKELEMWSITGRKVGWKAIK